MQIISTIFFFLLFWLIKAIQIIKLWKELDCPHNFVALSVEWANKKCCAKWMCTFLIDSHDWRFKNWYLSPYFQDRKILFCAKIWSLYISSDVVFCHHLAPVIKWLYHCLLQTLLTPPWFQIEYKTPLMVYLLPAHSASQVQMSLKSNQNTTFKMFWMNMSNIL